jgi:hypothetical protein
MDPLDEEEYEKELWELRYKRLKDELEEKEYEEWVKEQYLNERRRLFRSFYARH